jgi:hypothetical protein
VHGIKTDGTEAVMKLLHRLVGQRRYSNVAWQALMDQTRGDAKKVNRATIDRVLEKASAEV